MDNRSTNEEVNNVIKGTFPLTNSPVDIQITVHVTNLLTSGIVRASDFKEALYSPKNIIDNKNVIQLINHYGIIKMKQWFTLVYGWDFKKVG